MTYRSEQPALQAEAAELEAELESIAAQIRVLEERLARRTARTRSRFVPWVVVGLAAAVAFTAAHLAARRADAKQRDEELALIQSSIEFLEGEHERVELARDFDELVTPPWGTADSIHLVPDPELFQLIRNEDPNDLAGAWWIVAHAACRSRDLEYLRNEALRKLDELDPERRTRAGECP